MRFFKLNTSDTFIQRDLNIIQILLRFGCFLHSVFYKKKNILHFLLQDGPNSAGVSFRESLSVMLSTSMNLSPGAVQPSVMLH